MNIEPDSGGRSDRVPEEMVNRRGRSQFLDDWGFQYGREFMTRAIEMNSRDWRGFKNASDESQRD